MNDEKKIDPTSNFDDTAASASTALAFLPDGRIPWLCPPINGGERVVADI